MVFLKERVGARIRKTSYIPWQGCEPIDWKICNNVKNHYCEVEVYVYKLLGRYMVACMQYALPYEWNNRTKQTSFLRSGICPLSKCYAEKMMVRLNFIKDVLHLLTYCISARILLFISGTILSSRQFFWRREVSPLKANAMEKKWEWGLTSLKDVLHLSTHYSFLARMLFLI